MKRALIALAMITATQLAGATPWLYRGTLNDGGQPANGRYDMRLTLLDAAGEASISNAITLFDVPVRDGNFAAEVDFGVDLSQSSALKLKTEVQQNGSGFVGLGEPTNFDPKAALAGTCWDTEGNAAIFGEFLGTTNDVPLILKAFDTVVGNLTGRGTVSNWGDAPSVALGSSANEATAFGATVGGGGATRNGVGGFAAFDNRSSGIFSTVSGGYANTATNSAATVIGGEANTATGNRSTVSGGVGNCAGGDFSWAGGSRAKTRPGNGPNDGNCVANSGDFDGDNGTFIWADDQSSNAFVSTGPNQFAIRAAGGLRWSGTGVDSSISPAYAHLVTASNTCDGGSGTANSRTYLNHPLLNNNPDAVIVFSASFGSVSNGAAPPRNPLAIYYSNVASGTCPAGRWVIYQTTVTAETLNNGARYNIWFVLP